ncbi:MAG: MotA/TolQ/ExbB proton channel family protein, partial [Vallitaleaceae bacterium]|nr:MotA/TolQ/ExbB proton channel family protein [Vallitaleaceae bacterium]
REDAGDQSIDLHQIRTLKDRQSFYYHLFININAIFPLLGILGTVISLLRVTDLTNSLIVINFTTALTSTLWGLIFAIGFKTVDGVIGAKVEENEADFNLLINRIDHITKGDVDEA